MQRKLTALSFFGLVVVLLLTQVVSAAPPAPQEPAATAGQPVVRWNVTYDSFGIPKEAPERDPRNEDLIPLGVKKLPNRPGAAAEPQIDPAWQGDTSGTPSPDATIGANFEGMNNVWGVLPPDTNGDIGPNHYVQTVNLGWAVYNRSGTKLYGPADTNTLFNGFGAPCETTNNGDPIVLYDHLADRWLISQFAFPNGSSNGPYYQCVAISQTGDPLGSWHRYSFLISNTKLNDYPKFGVWPDGYYMSVNQFNQGTFSWGGQGVVVFERDKMLNGQAARMVYFDLYGVDSNLGGMLPSDLDGAVPPAGAPNPFVEMDDDSWGYSPDQLQLWEFKTDWNIPANSTFTKKIAMNVAAFDSNMCSGNRNCVPQPGTSAKLDAIADRLMFRLQYRNFGSYQTLVTNHTVDVDGTDRGGVRWYELRNTGSGWSIFQQGTYSPDSTDRWMASAAMNGSGMIAIGYSISSSSIYPSIRFTGRLAGDAAGQMTQGETSIISGNGSQTSTYYRWGDYSMMAVDPTDDCTFWYTTEYYASTSSAGWRTRVGSFKLANCGGPVDNPPTVTLTNPAEGVTVSGTITVSADATDDNGVTQVEFFVDSTSLGVDTSSPYSVSWNTTTATNGAHTVKAVAKDTIGQTAEDINNVTVSNGGGDTSMHIGDLDGTKSGNRNRWNASVTITVHNSTHTAVASAQVTGSWSNGGTSTCTTNSSGQCTVSKTRLPSSTASVTFTITNITKSGMTYNSAANHDPEADSNGTSITINKPQ